MKSIIMIGCCLVGCATAQSVKILTVINDPIAAPSPASVQNTSIRGLSVVDDTHIWVSGSNGATGSSADGGMGEPPVRC